jgi:hypothetical protein
LVALQITRFGASRIVGWPLGSSSETPKLENHRISTRAWELSEIVALLDWESAKAA